VAALNLWGDLRLAGALRLTAQSPWVRDLASIADAARRHRNS
jgi:hypothetical protein